MVRRALKLQKTHTRQDTPRLRYLSQSSRGTPASEEWCQPLLQCLRVPDCRASLPQSRQEKSNPQAKQRTFRILSALIPHKFYLPIASGPLVSSTTSETHDNTSGLKETPRHAGERRGLGRGASWADTGQVWHAKVWVTKRDLPYRNHQINKWLQSKRDIPMKIVIYLPARSNHCTALGGEHLHGFRSVLPFPHPSTKITTWKN